MDNSYNPEVETKFKVVKVDNPLSKTSYLAGMEVQLEWLKRQAEYFSFSQNYKICLSCKKGEIYEFDWGVNINAEFSHRHFGVVLADSNENNPLVLVCPLKTNKYGPNPVSDIDLGVIKELNTGNGTLAICNQIRSLDKTRIYKLRIIGNKNNVLNDSEASLSIDVPKLSVVEVNKILDKYLSLLDY